MATILGVLIPVTFVVALILERLFPARELPKVHGWLLKGFVFFFMTAALNTFIPALLADAVSSRAALHLGGLNVVLGGVIGFLASDMVSYAYHRLVHNVPFLWRWTHQMHHSAERVDIAGAAYFHPFDITASIATSTVPVLLLGLTPDGAALAGFIGFLAAMFQHLNVRTPQWLGYIFQRPEAHAVHHARGVHAYNYGNFMLWDILLGTFRNPTHFTHPAGFWEGASGKVFSMLIGRDVAAPTGTGSGKPMIQHSTSLFVD